MTYFIRVEIFSFHTFPSKGGYPSFHRSLWLLFLLLHHQVTIYTYWIDLRFWKITLQSFRSKAINLTSNIDVINPLTAQRNQSESDLFPARASSSGFAVPCHLFGSKLWFAFGAQRSFHMLYRVTHIKL